MSYRLTRAEEKKFYGPFDNIHDELFKDPTEVTRFNRLYNDLMDASRRCFNDHLRFIMDYVKEDNQELRGLHLGVFKMHNGYGQKREYWINVHRMIMVIPEFSRSTISHQLRTGGFHRQKDNAKSKLFKEILKENGLYCTGWVCWYKYPWQDQRLLGLGRHNALRHSALRH